MPKRKLTVKEIRESRGVMKKAAAAAVKCSYPTYNKFEDNPQLMTVQQLERLCNFLGVSSSDIFLPIDLN